MTFANDKAKAQADAATLANDLAKANADEAILAADIAALTPDPVVPAGYQISNVVVTSPARGVLLATFTLPTSPAPVSLDYGRDGTEADGVSSPNWAGNTAPAQSTVQFNNLADSKLYHLTITPKANGVVGVPVTVSGTTQAAPGTVVVGGDPAPVATLAWSDAAGVFPSNLHAELGGNGWGNGELETYTGRAVNAHCDGAGNLIIVARPENFTGTDGIARNFTSARLTTVNSLVLQPGTYVEVPVGYIPLDVLGAWPAVWTVGSDAPWPGGGEIDSPEGNNKKLWQTALHLASTAGNDQQYPWYDAIPMTDGPHVDGFYFDAERVQWYVDRKLVRQVVATPAAAAKDSRAIFSGDQPASSSGRVWPFGTHPQYLIFNIAVNDANFKGATMTIGGPVKAWKGNLPVKIIGG